MSGLRPPSLTAVCFPTVSVPPWIRAAIACALVCAVLPALAAADTLRGRVLDPDGQPIAGAHVSVIGAVAAPIVVRTDAAGAFAVDLPSGRTVDVRAWAPGLEGTRLGVPAAGDIEIRLALRAVSESVTVTASHVGVPFSTLADSATVLTGEELAARQISTVGEALRLVPGFSVARNGGPGTVTSVFPRGGESDFTLVLVDGVRANAFGGGVDLSQIPLGDVERVEVVRGPQSALHGSDAIGGVVQVITAAGGPLALTASAEAGGRGARHAQASARGAVGHWQGRLAVDDARDDGFTGRAPADGSTVSNDDSRVSLLSAGGGWRNGRGAEVTGSLAYVDTDRGSPGPYGANPAGNFGGVDRTARSLTWRRSAAGRVVMPLGGSSSRVRLRADADVSDFDLEFRSNFGSRGETHRTHGRVQVDGAFSNALSASAGVDTVRESGRSTYVVAGSTEVPVERGVWAGFVEARWQPSARVALTAGARAERITRDALAADPSPFGPRPAFAPQTVVAVTPKVTAAWSVVPEDTSHGASTRLHAAAGTGIRPPDAFEIAFTDNDGLEPERSRSVEAGVTQGFGHGAVHLDATWFHNTYDDLIVSVGRLSSASRFRTDNIANARARGAEVSLAVRPTARLAARVSYTWLDAEILAVDGGNGSAPSPFAPGDRLLRRPRHQGSLDVTWGTSHVQAFALAELRGRTLDVEPNFGTFGGLFENRGHTVVSLGGAWTIHPALSLYARVANAFDTAYEDTLGYPALGRTAYVGLRLAARR